MKYEFLPRALWGTAEVVRKQYERASYRTVVERPLQGGYRFRPTFVFHRGGERVIVEVRRSPELETYFKDFVKECLARREPVKLYVAVSLSDEGEETHVELRTLEEYETLGVGLAVIDNWKYSERRVGVECHLRFRLPPGRRLGPYQKRVNSLVRKFNSAERVDAIRELTELVEEAVSVVGVKAVKKKRVNPTEAEFLKSNWETRINMLYQKEWHGRPQQGVIDDKFKNDLMSFKGARHVSHHPRSRREQMRLNEQYLERMEQGVRLLREMLRIRDRL